MKNINFKILFIILVFSFGVIHASASSVVSVDKKNKTLRPPVLVLVYHSFGAANSKKESAMQLHYRVTAPAFEEQMKYLSLHGYNPISFASYVDSLKNNTKLPDKAIVLTFDDGWQTQYQYAVPILEKYNFTATFFVITDYVNNNYKAYMNWDNLKDLVAHNFDVESHTQTHPILVKLSTQKLNLELVESKRLLEEKLKIKVTTLAYPYYAENKIIRDAVKSAGYSGARAGSTKFENSADDIYEIRAQEVVNNPNPFSSQRLPDLP